MLFVVAIQINEKMNQQNAGNYIDDQVMGKELLNKAPFAKPHRQQKVVACCVMTSVYYPRCGRAVGGNAFGAGWLAVWLAGWLAGWLAVCLYVCLDA